MPGNQNVSPPGNATITLDNNAATNTTANPYSFSGISPYSHTVTASVPNGYYLDGYTLCFNSTGCHNATPTPAVNNSVTLDCPTAGYADLWWHYEPLPTPYPTAAITGTLEQDSQAACYPTGGGNTFDKPSIAISTADPCITPVCSPKPNADGTLATGYQCLVNFDNRGCFNTGQMPPTSTTFTLNANLTDYGTGSWRDPAGAGYSCQPATSTMVVGIGDAKTKDISFPFSGTEWFKIKDASFITSSTSHVVVPAIVNKYSTGDTDDSASQKTFIMTTTQPSGDEAGTTLGLTVNPSTSYSDPHNWSVNTYTRTVGYNVAKYIDYAKSRKSYTPITQSNLSEITADGIYIWTGTNPLVIDNTNVGQLNSHNIVLVDNGEIQINVDQLNPSKDLAIIADTITFSATTQQATGIFVANNVNTGTAANQGLKIIGNLSALTSFNNQRAWSDTSKPAIFVVFKTEPYMTLLPYLSISKYDWQQLQ